MLLFSPNPIFSSYVSTVLPELGEENIKQMTFQDYIDKRLGKLFTLETPFEQMEFILSEKDHPTYQIRKESIRIKADILFKNMIDSFVEKLSEEGLFFKNITLNNEVLIPASDIEEYFYHLDYKNSIQNRIQDTARWLLKELSNKEEIEREKDWVLEEIELLDSDTYIHSFKELEKEKAFTEDTFDDYEREQSLLINKIIQERFRPIRAAIKALRFVHVTALYIQLFTKENLFIKNICGSTTHIWKEISKLTTASIKEKCMPYEDQAPYLYLMDKLIGNKVDRTTKHLFIDEAQDYSPIQFHVLKQLFPSCKMTILGDFNQAILAQSHDAPTMLSDELYDIDKFEKMILTKSYRSTKQIVDFSKGIIEANANIETFERFGPEPTITIAQDNGDLHSQIVDQLLNLKKTYDTIAVICKTEKESRFAHEAISKKLECQLIHSKSKTYRKGIVILPTYLAKGVEFDAVIIYNASSEVYSQDIERKILYTSCTRAMHELHLFSVGECSPFLRKITENL
ncbi:MAG: helicase [Bacillales bacterium]|nr:helicase [Bacillales bacterium]